MLVCHVLPTTEVLKVLQLMEGEKECLDRLMQHGLIVFHRQHVVSATLDDSPGNDTLNASGGLAELIYSGGHKVRLNGFDTVTARGTNGGVNRRNVTGTLAYVLNFTGTWL